MHPGNAEAYSVYSRCSGQLIVAGMSGVPVDIMVTAVKTIMDLEEVEDQRNVMRKVQYLARVVLAENSKKMSEK